MYFRGKKMGSYRLALDHRFDRDITQHCITLEEEVLEFLLRSFLAWV